MIFKGLKILPFMLTGVGNNQPILNAPKKTIEYDQYQYAQVELQQPTLLTQGYYQGTMGASTIFASNVQTYGWANCQVQETNINVSSMFYAGMDQMAVLSYNYGVLQMHVYRIDLANGYVGQFRTSILNEFDRNFYKDSSYTELVEIKTTTMVYTSIDTRLGNVLNIRNNINQIMSTEYGAAFNRGQKLINYLIGPEVALNYDLKPLTEYNTDMGVNYAYESLSDIGFDLVYNKVNYIILYTYIEGSPQIYSTSSSDSLQIMPITQTTEHVELDYVSQPATPEVIDLPGLCFDILTMPFTFISQAFNLTLFAGTPYQINISALFLAILGTLTFIVILKFLLNKG